MAAGNIPCLSRGVVALLPQALTHIPHVSPPDQQKFVARPSDAHAVQLNGMVWCNAQPRASKSINGNASDWIDQLDVVHVKMRASTRYFAYIPSV
jgi:hypothetical protein